MRGRDFHPDLSRIGPFLPKQVVSPITLPFIRWVDQLAGRRPPDGIEVVTLSPDVSVRVFRPALAPTPAPALLWIHGGGYIMGTAARDDKICARFADELGAVVASVNYRLAPEHPYPAAVEDCYAALLWLAGLADVNSARLAIGGASAGGGLAAALALEARDRAEIPIIAQLLVYPMLDDRTASRQGMEHRGVRLWNQRSNRLGWRSYLGNTDPDVAVPARRGDLTGLPPAWIGVGDFDLFHDEDLAYAERLRAAGVPCEVEVVPGAFHGFDVALPRTALARSFSASQCAMLRRSFAGAIT